MNTQNISKRGFTLLELLIVISIIAILSVILIVALNPAETLKKARDTQRISDFASMKTAIGIYATTKSSPDLDDALTTFCLGETDNTLAQIGYSKSVADATCNVNLTPGADATAGSDFNTADFCTYVASPTNTEVDGDGWVPVDLASITGGSPISNLPLDPINTVATNTTPVSTDLVYRYACQNTATSPAPATVFEFNAILESAAYGPGSSDDDKSAKDGGDNTAYYEVGTTLRLLPTGTNF